MTLAWHMCHRSCSTSSGTGAAPSGRASRTRKGRTKDPTAGPGPLDAEQMRSRCGIDAGQMRSRCGTDAEQMRCGTDDSLEREPPCEALCEQPLLPRRCPHARTAPRVFMLGTRIPLGPSATRAGLTSAGPTKSGRLGKSGLLAGRTASLTTGPRYSTACSPPKSCPPPPPPPRRRLRLGTCRSKGR